VVLQSGRVRVNFAGPETCGFDNPHLADARGCRVIDDDALMCRGFGVIDDVLFAEGCEAPASVELIEVSGTAPVTLPANGDDPLPDDSLPDDPLPDDPLPEEAGDGADG
jgi:hypothetical protein